MKLLGVSEPLCPKCKREYPKGWSAALSKRRSDNIKAGLAKADRVGRRRKIDYAEVRRLRAEGMTYRELTKHFSASRGSIQHALRSTK